MQTIRIRRQPSSPWHSVEFVEYSPLSVKIRDGGGPASVAHSLAHPADLQSRFGEWGAAIRARYAAEDVDKTLISP